MIKVLERKELTKYQTRCDKCRSLLEYDCTDTFSEHHVNSYGSYDSYYIVCPVCKRKVDVRTPT